MDSSKRSRSDKRRTFLSAIGIVAAVMVLAPPVVQAASQKVNVVKSIDLTVKGSVNVKQLTGTSDAVGDGTESHGGLPGEVTPRSVNTNSMAAGDGFWGVAICGHPAPGENEVLVPAAAVGAPDNTISHVLVGSPDAAKVQVITPDLPSGLTPVIEYETTDEEPSASIDLSSGIRVSPSDIIIKCVDGGTLPTDGTDVATVAVLGH